MQQTSPQKSNLMANNKGQIVLEYILLLMFAVTFALLITNKLVGRNPDSPGVIIQKWSQINQMIGTDKGD